ncbi:4'-phosphopantetheinyl transferase superfamily protein [Bifidobacterium sp. ESL0775]|uniref:holo-ACP synthase n=1 Tax=Bifidobacterium sp. ESL0775 TaxID=2983230 RepID=UPI0023F7DF9D|nr:4'-phosphopantetheinyl transferase superfamily protein [Bifidobacterium sp. ESL0775]WEV69670.1 4'-phosphopantetheinyl transferase superfamily protein [Bifidobacterium sp. ESL0775]
MDFNENSDSSGLSSGVLGIGHDVVDVDGFAAQLGETGSRMRGLFSTRELRQAAARAKAKHDGQAVHLAVRWAGKEAVLKAWCEALGERPNPYTLDDFPWAQIEILDDSRSRPRVVLSQDCEATLLRSLGARRTETAGADEESSDVVSGDEVSADGVSSDGDSFAFGGGRLGAGAPTLRWHVSLSHDGPIASAVALLVGESKR